MSLMDNSCSCGWSMNDKGESLKECVRCGRKAEKRSFGWSVSKPTQLVDILITPSDKRDYADSIGVEVDIPDSFFFKK